MALAAKPVPLTANATLVAAATLLLASATILGALGFEYIGGYIPCPLCLEQRYAYYLGIPLLLVVLWALYADRPRLAAWLLFAVSLAFLANAGLGVYQSGAEWKFWPGPDTCSGAQAVAGKATDLLRNLGSTRVIRCDEAALRIFGLSFAGWNAVISLVLSVAALKAAFLSTTAR